MPAHASLRSRVNAVRVAGQNRLLALLAPAERERVMGRCDRVQLEQRTVVYDLRNKALSSADLSETVLDSIEESVAELFATGQLRSAGTDSGVGTREQGEAVRRSVRRRAATPT